MSKNIQRWELVYDQDIKILKFSLGGSYQRHSILFFHKTICESIVEMGANKLLADLYNVILDYDLSTIDLSLVPQLYEAYSVPTELSIAIIIPQEQEYLDIFLNLEQVCNEYSYNVKLFENKTAANLWLSYQSLSF